MVAIAAAQRGDVAALRAWLEGAGEELAEFTRD